MKIPLFLQLVWSYLYNNYKSILNILLFAIFVNFLFIRYATSSQIISIEASANEYTFLAFFSAILLISFKLFKPTKSFFRKYKNTYLLKKLYFTTFDYIIWFIYFSIIILLIRSPIDFSKVSSRFNTFIFITFFYLLVWFLILSFYEHPTKRNKESIESFNILSDQAIPEAKYDILGRNDFVQLLYKEMVSIRFQTSFAFGLYGAWGDGKTSVLNLLRNKFLDNQNFMIVNFNPWYYKDENAILKAFYTSIENILKKNLIFPNIKDVFKKYIRAITTGVSSKGINFSFALKNEAEDPLDLKRKIEEYILQANKKIIIIIDDIDRLPENEILLLFKLVRLNMDIKNVIFVLSLDLETTVKKIKRCTRTNGYDYIEKIIQKPIPLPKIEPDILDRMLLMSDHKVPKFEFKDLILGQKEGEKVSVCGIISKIADNYIELQSDNPHEQIASIKVQGIDNLKLQTMQLNLGEKIFVNGKFQKKEINVDVLEGDIKRYRLSLIDDLFRNLLVKKKISYKQIEEFDKEFVTLYMQDLRGKIRNLRSAKRYFNSLTASLGAIIEEINLKDFFVLEFIKVFNLKLYDDMWENYWAYVDQRSDSEVPIFNRRFYRNENQKEEDRKSHIRDILAKTSASELEKEIFKNSLKNLFSKVREIRDL